MLASTSLRSTFPRLRDQASFSVMSWGMALGAWIPGILYDYIGTHQLALLPNVVIAWITCGLLLGLREWREWSHQHVSSPAL